MLINGHVPRCFGESFTVPVLKSNSSAYCKQESCAVAKMTAQCALYGALKMFMTFNGTGNGDKRMRVGSGKYATGYVTVTQRSLLEQPTVTQTSTLRSSDGDNSESHSSADDTIIMSSHDN